MSSQWEKAPLEELTEDDSPITYGVVKPGTVGDVLFVRGGDLSNGRILHSQLRTITKEISDQYKRTLLRGNELLVSLVGQPGQVAVVPSALAGANIARQVGLVRLRSGIDANFISYFLQSPDGRKALGTYTGGSVQQVINLCDLRTVDVPIPPLSEQQQIVALVDNAFEGIDRAIANTEKNLTNARELFESYLNTAFTQKDDGWVEKKLGDIALLSRGQNPPKSKFVSRPQEGYVRFYQIRDGKTDDYEVYVPDTPQLHRVEPDDILMVAYRHIGRVFRGASGAFNVALCKIKNKDRLVLHDDYLFHIIPTDFVRGELMKQAERSLIPSMSVKHLAEIKIPVPPIAEQEIIVSKINKIQNETQRLEAIYQQKLAALNELKQTILQKAFTGELTADTANQAIKTAEGAIAA